jgi:hypothetical protein
MYKTAKYEYSSTSGGGGGGSYSNDRTGYNNERGNLTEINKLDTLLNDLEHERTATLDRSTRMPRAPNSTIGKHFHE